jgi:hypothetical protein
MRLLAVLVARTEVRITEVRPVMSMAPIAEATITSISE